MKGFFNKAVVAVGVMVSALALSSVCAWAGISETKEYNFTNYTQVTNDPDTTTYAGLTITGKPAAIASDKGAGITLSKSDASDTIQFTVDKKFSLDLTSNHSNKSKGTIVTCEGKVYPSTTNGTKADLSLSDLPAGTYTIKSDGSNHAYITTMKITVAASVTKNYTINVTDAITGDSVDFTIKDGAKTITPSSGVYSLDTSITYTVSADGYPNTELVIPTDDSTTIDMELLPTNAATNELNLSNIGITSDETTTTAHNTATGFLINSGIMNNKDKFIRVNNTGSIQFKLTTAGLAKFTGITSSSSSSIRTLTLTGDNGSEYSFSTDGTSIDKDQKLAAGTYTIGTPDGSMQFVSLTVYGTLEELPVPAAIAVTKTTSTSKVAVVAVDDTYYAVAIIDPTVSGATVEGTDVNLDVTVSYNEESVAINSVYKSVTINGTEYKASDLGGNGNQYVYGFTVTPNTSVSNIADDIQGKVTVTQSVYSEA